MNIGSTTGSAFTTATAGINNGLEQTRRAAKEVVDATTARPVEGIGSLADGFIELKQGHYQIEANTLVLQAENQRSGTLIDMKA